MYFILRMRRVVECASIRVCCSSVLLHVFVSKSRVIVIQLYRDTIRHRASGGYSAIGGSYLLATTKLAYKTRAVDELELLYTSTHTMRIIND